MPLKISKPNRKLCQRSRKRNQQAPQKSDDAGVGQKADVVNVLARRTGIDQEGQHPSAPGARCRAEQLAGDRAVLKGHALPGMSYRLILRIAD